METNGKAVTALEIQQQPASGSIAYEPRNYDEAMRLAMTYAKSNLLGELKSPEAALLIMATGAELGIPATAALRGIYIVKGRPILSADLMVALCLKRVDICEYFTCLESTNERATFETKRVAAGPVRNTFSIEDARAAGLTGNDTYKKYPRVMLRHRAAAELARMVYPEITLGLYCLEEGEEIAASPTRAPAPVIADAEIVQPEEQTDDEKIAGWTAKLEAAASLTELTAIGNEIRALPKSEAVKLALSTVYGARKKALKAQPEPTPEREVGEEG